MPQDLDKVPEKRGEPMRSPRKISLFKTKEEMALFDYVQNYLLETLGIVFWIYVVTQLFVFNIDSWIFARFLPSYGWILKFKLIFILALTSLTWLLIGTRDMSVWFFYIAFYPPILLLIRLPYFIFTQESWLLAFAILNAIVSFFRSVRCSLIFTTIFLGAVSVALFSRADYLLFIAAAILVALTLVAYGRGFLTALKPTAIFQLYSNLFQRIRKTGRTSFELDEEIRGLPIERLTNLKRT